MRGRSRTRRRGGGCSAAAVVAIVGSVMVVLGPSASATPPPATSVPCTGNVRVCVQLGAARAWLLAPGGGVLRGPVPITSGAAGMETPTGRFTVQRKNAHQVSSFGGTPMPWSVFFDNRGRALHGGSLQRLSRGCVHLADRDARAFFDALAPGEPLQILP